MLRPRWAAACVALLLFLPALQARLTAQTPPRPGTATDEARQQVLTALETPGDLTLRNSSIESALFSISELWRINIVVGEVEGSVTGVFKAAPLREILDSILLSNGYAYRSVGGSLVVSSLEELGQINPFFVSDTIPVAAASVEEVLAAAELMSTPQGQVRAIPSAKAILVVDFPDRVAKVRTLVEQIDAATRTKGGKLSAPQELEVAYFRTHYIRAEEAQLALAAVLSPLGQATALQAEDRLVVVDYSENLNMVESVLARLDRPRPQVKIRALIYDISLTDLEEIGVNWNLLSRGETNAEGGPISGTGIQLDALNKTPFDTGATGTSFTFFSLENDVNIQAVILALQQAEDSRLLADPNVTVIDNEIALLESVQEIPFQQLTQTSAGGQIGTTAFKEAGIKLEVQPKIAHDGTIHMAVTPEFSRLAGFTPNDNQPIIDTRRATTRVRVTNRQTLMIAGMRQRSDVGEFNGVPFLKDVRYFGHLFRARDTQIQESELVVFITPEIVGYSDPLSHRDQLTADTVGCRLDRIPAAEGCCPHGCPLGVPCQECHGSPDYLVDPGPCDVEIVTPTPVAPVTQEPAGLETIEQGLMVTPDQASSDVSKGEDGDPLRYPELHSARNGVEVTPQGATQGKLPDYATRFRSDGTSFGKQATPEEEAEKVASEARKQLPWHERIWRR